MKQNLIKFTVLSLIFNLITSILPASDTTRILSHREVTVVTNPSKGENRYPAAVTFPKSEAQFRKVNLHVTFRCPDGLQCGEWDYIDYINLKTRDPLTGKDIDYEIARLITPYGRFFGTTWSFTFSADITDFSSLLRNNATIEYVHTGYESNTTCGWKVTVEFEFISGPPVAGILDVIPMWNGSFPYGDTTKDIENYLVAKKVTATEKTGLMRLRILQTGHGMDKTENCAEFCSKYRDVLFDNQIVEHRDVWSECATNPVYPQAGTWIYDRANWCPGCMVDPEGFSFLVLPGSVHEIDVDMQPYRATIGEATANYVFSSFLILCEKPRARHDATIEAILAPSAEDNYSRMNPIGYEPRIRIRNNGIEALQSLRIDYGLTGATPMTYTWKGRLDFGKSTEIVLPGILESSKKQDLFTVTVSKPNNRQDEYTNDNRMTSVWNAPPVFPESFIIVCKTNRDSSQTAWTLTDATGKVVYRKTEQELAVNTEYRDTVTLSHGHFQLLVTDSEGDGLEFWANPRGGMGSVKLVSLDGQLIRSYGSDFGNEIRQVFTVDKTKPVSPYQDALVMVYPHRPVQNTTLMLFFNQPQTVRAKLTTADGKVLQEMAWFEVRENNFQIDLSNYPDAIYMLELKYGDKTENIRLKKAGRR